MSKFHKARDVTYNDFIAWKITSIVNSNKIGSCRWRSKLFFIESPEGKKFERTKILYFHQHHELPLTIALLGRMYEYRMQKPLTNSISIVCNARGCDGRLSLAIDPSVIHIEDGVFTDENDDTNIENILNYRLVNLRESEHVIYGRKMP